MSVTEMQSTTCFDINLFCSLFLYGLNIIITIEQWGNFFGLSKIAKKKKKAAEEKYPYTSFTLENK